MKFLLDTHIWIWSLMEPERLNAKVTRVLESRESELWLSPISVWETLVLVEKGRVVLSLPVDEWLNEALKVAPMHEAPLTFEIVRLSRSIKLSHDDPADRFIAATAIHLNLKLITANKRLLKSRDLSILANL